jgi:hypothetical protein
MPKRTGNVELIQVRVSSPQKRILEEYANSQHITVAELTRQQLRLLISRIVTGQQAG